MEYSVFPEGVSMMILDFLGMDGHDLLHLPNIPFVRLNLERYSSILTSVDVLIKEHAVATSQHEKDQMRLIKTEGKVVKFVSEKSNTDQELEYVHKQIYSTRVRDEGWFVSSLRTTWLVLSSPIIMEYLGNHMRDRFRNHGSNRRRSN
jgi:hypothetical protein